MIFNVRKHAYHFSKFVNTFLILCLLIIPAIAFSQDAVPPANDSSICVQKDLKDVLGKKKKATDTAEVEKKVSLLLFPIIGSNPATGFMVGVGGQAAFKI